MCIRILFITPSFYPATYYGGPSESVYYLAREIVKRAKKISVVTTDANGKKNLTVKKNEFIELEKGLLVKYYSNSTSFGFSIKMFFNLHKDIKDADLIYLVSIFSPPTPLTLFLNIFFRKKIIISPRGQLGEWCLAQGNSLKKLWLKFIISPFAKNLIWHATSLQEEEMIKKVYSKANIWIIPNGIDIDKFKDIEHKKDRIFYKKYSDKVNQNSKIIISMGRLQKVKGFDILIEAYKKFQEQVQDSFLFIAGEDFGEKSNLQNLISSNHLFDKIFLVGPIEGEEKINFLKNADVFALPSHHENFGMVYAEALAVGTPIIASRNTPWSEVEKYKIGKWVENNAASFANAIYEIMNINDPSINKRCREFVTSNYSWETIALRMINKFEGINNG